MTPPECVIIAGMASKPFWQSTTFWVAVATMAGAAWDAYQPYIPASWDHGILAVLGAVFLALRLYTVRPIKGSPKERAMNATEQG